VDQALTILVCFNLLLGGVLLGIRLERMHWKKHLPEYWRWKISRE
jgi:hypothetical protein